MGEIFIKPIAGATVRYPVSMAILPAAGAVVSLDDSDGKYWRRRLMDGSVVIAVPDKPEITQAPIVENSKDDEEETPVASTTRRGR